VARCRLFYYTAYLPGKRSGDRRRPLGEATRAHIATHVRHSADDHYTPRISPPQPYMYLTAIYTVRTDYDSVTKSMWPRTLNDRAFRKCNPPATYQLVTDHFTGRAEQSVSFFGGGGQPFVKRFALCYRTAVLFVCLSVCLSCPVLCDVGVLWPNGWTDQAETWPRPRPQCVRWGPSSPKRGLNLPVFRPCPLWPNGWMD